VPGAVPFLYEPLLVRHRLVQTTRFLTPRWGPASKWPVDGAGADAAADGPSKSPFGGRPPTAAWTPANGRRRPRAPWETGTAGFPRPPTGPSSRRIGSGSRPNPPLSLGCDSQLAWVTTLLRSVEHGNSSGTATPQPYARAAACGGSADRESASRLRQRRNGLRPQALAWKALPASMTEPRLPDSGAR
jgi:hypothetical protein